MNINSNNIEVEQQEKVIIKQWIKSEEDIEKIEELRLEDQQYVGIKYRNEKVKQMNMGIMGEQEEKQEKLFMKILKELNDIDWHLENFNGLINEIMCKSIRTERKNQKINLLDKDYQQQMIIGCKYKTITEILQSSQQKKYQNPFVYMENKKQEQETERQVQNLKKIANFVSHSQIQFYQGVMRNINQNQEFIYLNFFTDQIQNQNAESVFLFLEKQNNQFTISYNQTEFEKMLQIRVMQGDKTIWVSHSLLSTQIKQNDILYIRNKFIENILLFNYITNEKDDGIQEYSFKILDDYCILFELIGEDQICTDRQLLYPYLYQVRDKFNLLLEIGINDTQSLNHL